jgi:hypothetical protein
VALGADLVQHRRRPRRVRPVERAIFDHLPDPSWGVVAVDGLQLGLLDDLRVQDRLWLVVAAEPLVLLRRQLAV